MTYIRNPRDRFWWESDGHYDGKFKADDGTLHDSPDEVVRYEERQAEARGEKGKE